MVFCVVPRSAESARAPFPAQEQHRCCWGRDHNGIGSSSWREDQRRQREYQTTPTKCSHRPHTSLEALYRQAYAWGKLGSSPESEWTLASPGIASLSQLSPALVPLEHVALIILFGGAINSDVTHTVKLDLLPTLGEGEFFVQRLPGFFIFRQWQ